jgi:hypothetical protein
LPSEQPLFVRPWTLQGVESIQQGCWPMLTPMLPAVVSSWLDVLWDTVEHEKQRCSSSHKLVRLAPTTSGVKYLSKNTLKHYLSIFLGGVSVLYFTIYIFANFYFCFSIFLKKIMYFLLHTFSLIPKSTHYILIGKWSNSHTYQENIPGHPYCF